MTDIPSAGSILVADLIGDDVVRIPAEATISQAATVMAQRGVGAVVVGDEARPGAVLSERDVVRAVAGGRDAGTTPVTEFASTDLVWCEDTDSTAVVATRMTDRYIRHILVERDGVLAGMVSARDLLGVYAGDADRLD